jgi:UDP-galactopyranose mutase
VRNPRWLESRTNEAERTPAPGFEDLVCFSHLGWDFVFQRPQHLLTRAARTRRVFYIEEPRWDANNPCIETKRDPSGVTVAIPHVPRELPESHAAVQALIDFLLSVQRIHHYVAWYYTPMGLRFSSHLRPLATVYDCMDELSAFAGAPPGLVDAERTLLARSDLVLTGGHSLYLAKRDLHPSVHEFPSGVDVEHFAKARRPLPDPADQASIPRPRIGFFGVLDERLDRELLAGMAAAAPELHFVMIGPVTKIDPGSLPSAPNIHYLGAKSYASLPDYIANWDVAMLPFARNDATRFISPTKTPEYLAAGRPVVSTSITDVVHPYGEQRLARIADSPADFIAAIREALAEPADDRQARADAALQHMSWDGIWSRIATHLEDTVRARSARRQPSTQVVGRTESRRL